MKNPPDDPVLRALRSRFPSLIAEALRRADKRRERMTRMGISPENQRRVNARALSRLLTQHQSNETQKPNQQTEETNQEKQ
jgi:hypothetical protein